MKKYVDHVRIGMKEYLVYPSAVWAKLFSKIIYLYLQFCIWSALFASNSMKHSELNKADTLRYIVVATIVSTVIECNVIEKVNAQIQSGNIATELIRPIGFKRMLLARHLGDTAIKILCYLVPLIVLVKASVSLPLLCCGQIGLGILSVSLAYGIQFLYSLVIGLLAFWLIVTWPINMFFGAIYKLLSGAWIPVTMFPETLNRINIFLPFRAIYAIPISILTSSMKVIEIRQSIGVQVMWLVILYILVQIIWRVGRNKLVVQGG
ncbi:MAG: ABC-2 family transporter protein [Lachnospiraceae bacterium]|nr:ABC-2 family transporter protein [Lachnospiraceae bacterium]